MISSFNARQAAQKKGIFRNFYDWCLIQAKTPQAERVLFWLAFIESSVFPFPPDVLLILMVLSHRERWRRYFIICTLGSVLGGIAGYLIGLGIWELVHGWFYTYVFSPEAFLKVQSLYQTYDFWIVFAAAFTPIPYKVFTITAGVTQINPLSFLIASIVGRGGRFILVAFLLHHFGPPVRNFIEKYFNYVTIAFTALLIGGFVAVKYLTH